MVSRYFALTLLFTADICMTRIQRDIPVGLLLESKNVEIYQAYQFKFDEENRRAKESKVNSDDGHKFTLNRIAEDYIDISSNYDYNHTFCNQMAAGVAVIFGLYSTSTADFVTSSTSMYHMPFISTSPPELFRPPSEFMIHLQPRYEDALADYMIRKEWKEAIYMYRTNEALARLYHIIGAINRGHAYIVVIFKHVTDVLDALAALAQYDKDYPHLDTTKNIIIDLSVDETNTLLTRRFKEVPQYRLKYNYLIAGLQINELDFSEFPNGGINITGFHLTESHSPKMEKVLNEWKGRFVSSRKSLISHQLALAMDAVDVFTQAMHNLTEQQEKMFNNGSFRLSCALWPSKPTPWPLGKMITQAIRRVGLHGLEGLTGKIVFDDRGFRTNFTLQLTSTTIDHGLAKVGTWTPNPRANRPRLSFFEKPKDSSGLRDNTVRNKTYLITSIESAPFMMVRTDPKPGGGNWTGNDRYVGFCKDIADKLAQSLGINYTINLVGDKNYGGYDPENHTHPWDGMVAELINGVADLAIADLSITLDREKFIDFSKPFMNLGISIMIKKPEEIVPNIFSFMDPLSDKIWMCITFAYLAVSVVLFLVTRFSASEWVVEENEEDNGDPEVHNDFNFINSLWFSLAAFMQQGCELCPKSISGRIVGSVWWFFTLIIISSYTANLAAFLTVSRMNSPIQSADDLAKQTDIAYGCIVSGSTKKFFQDSKISTFERMWAYMSSADNNVFVKSNKEGVEKVRKSNGKYAYLLESTVNEYLNNRYPCDTMKVGSNLDSKGYGVGMPKGSPLRDSVTLAVLELLENGEIEKRRRFWWEESEGGGEKLCPKENSDKNDPASSAALSIVKIAGIFLILLGGMGLALVLSIMELFYRTKLDAMSNNITFSDEMKTKAQLLVRGRLEKEPATDASPVHKSVSTYTYSTPSAQLITLDGYSDAGNTHTQV
ncbi:glutamate receptor 2-like [Lingula anatina]|uniref:Glutamate receptor 2-like n=1 Tax=Lingula anatina TaxID=7574 RepID=A0A1S3KEK4_LINAN|nr:glutamate receptor 2-like [Lingula anatina]|eukprot:XP_013421058.1 glutamate receptor 2-like [Lingula anatina]